MFDWIKLLLGLAPCAGCRWRRCFGLYCGCPNTGHFPHKAWNFTGYGCWHYASPPRMYPEDYTYDSFHSHVQA